MHVSLQPFGPSDPDSRELANFYFIIEIPKGVQPPSTLRAAFSDFCTSLEKHQTFLFSKRSPRQPPEEEIAETIDAVLHSVPVLISKKESNYQEIIDSLDFRYPRGSGRR
ncbi:MAG: hypothetical protein D6696_19870 [Acidobacteria bacterium]|nr:MAG: hypothetical protein D6696_19870 [Acidobacteriota bacterium]